MRRIFTIMILALVSLPAIAWEPVSIRTDGRITDSTGKIIAVPNPRDERNTQYKKFYMNSDQACPKDQQCDSDFYIVAHPSGGYMRSPSITGGKPLEEELQQQGQDQQQQGNGFKTVKAGNGMVISVGEREATSRGGIYDNVNTERRY